MDMCKHTEFKSEVRVSDMGDGTFKVDLCVTCASCFKPLEFLGMEAGVHPTRPTVSIDGIEARLNAKLLS